MTAAQPPRMVSRDSVSHASSLTRCNANPPVQGGSVNWIDRFCSYSARSGPLWLCYFYRNRYTYLGLLPIFDWHFCSIWHTKPILSFDKQERINANAVLNTAQNRATSLVRYEWVKEGQHRGVFLPGWWWRCFIASRGIILIVFDFTLESGAFEQFETRWGWGVNRYRCEMRVS